MSEASGPAGRWRLWLGMLIAWGVGCSALLAWRQQVVNEQLVAQRFRSLSSSVESHLVDRMVRYQYGLRGARGAIMTVGPEGITRPLFRAYHESRNIETEFAGARGFGFIRRVPIADQERFTRQARQDGLPEFHVRQIKPHDGERFVIQYIEPVEINRSAVGLDIASEPARRLAAMQSMRSGQTTLTSPITLVQATHRPQRGFLLLLPIYRMGMPLQTPAQREAATYGWTYAPLIIDEVLDDIGLDDRDYTLALFDAPEGRAPEQFFGPAMDSEVQGYALIQQSRRAVFGRSWLLKIQPTARFIDSLRLVAPRTVFAGGVLTTVLAGVLLYAYLLNRHRRRLLWAQQVRLSTVMRNTSDAIVGQSLHGEILSWNRAAERIFGYSADEAIGEPVREMLPMEQGDEDEARIHARIAKGVTVTPFDTRVRRRDGSWVDVSVTASPITGPTGEVVGIGRIIRDISASKAAERQLREFMSTLEDQVKERTVQLEAAHRHLQAILDGLPSMVGYWDKDLINRFANEAYCHWYGIEPGGMVGMHLRQLLGHDIFERNLPYVEAVLRGAPQSFERAIQRPDDSRIRHSLAHYIPDLVEGEVRGFYVLVHDITELTESREKLDATLRESQALLHTIQMHSIYSEADAKGNILDVNEAFCQISGYSRQELIGHSHRLVNSGVHPGRFWGNMWRTISNGRAWRGEVCNRAKNGSLYWVDSIIAPFIGTEGQIEKYVSLSTDVTVTRLATEALMQERERLDNILAGTNVGTWEWNIQTGEVRFNERWAQMLGHSLAEMEPTTIQRWAHLCHPDDLLRARELLLRHFRGLDPYYETEVRMRHRDGHWIWALSRGRVMRWDDQHRAQWMAGTQLDITERKLAEERLRATSEAFLERAGRVAGVGGWEVNLASGAMTLTSQTRRIYELPEHQPLSLEDTFAYYEASAQPRIREAVRAAIDHGEGWDLELPFVTGSGRHIWVRIVGEAEYDEQSPDRPSRLIGALQDVTAKHVAEDALREAKAVAEAASSAKSEFLANMSHEIRTPLNAVIGLTHLLGDTALDSEQQQFVGNIQSAGRSLLSVINDVLDLSKIEAGELDVDPAPFSLSALLQDVDEMFSPAAGGRPIEFRFDIEPGLPTHLVGDVVRIRQILINLLGNAFKFTERGRVTLRLEQRQRTDAQVVLRFSVQDTGLGMPRDVVARLFTPFMQADASTTRRFGGTGLGLSIVRRLADLMSGEVSVDSVEGEGSTFRVDLPLQIAPDLDEGGAVTGGALVVWLIGQAGAQRQTMATMVSALGWHCSEMETLDVAIEAWQQAQASGTLPDVLLAQGPAAPTRRWAALGSRQGEGMPEHGCPLIVWDEAWHPVKGDAHDLDPVDAVLPWPPTAASLFNAVNQALARRGESTDRLLRGTRLDAVGALWLQGVSVLVVDDSDINREVARRILVREGATVLLARHGQEALSQLAQAGARVDAVLMDVQMPVMDGHEATRRLREQMGRRTLPVIALTAGALVSERQRAFEAGASDFLSKPFDPQTLVRTLRLNIERASGRPLHVVPRSGAGVSAKDWPELEGIDSDTAAQRFGGDLGMYAEMLDRLFREFGGLRSVQLSEVPEERAALAGDLHKLRGTAGMLGARVLMQLAGRAESAVRQGEPRPELVSHLERLGRALEALDGASAPLRERLRQEVYRLDPGQVRPVSPDEMAELMGLLQARDLSAVARFQALVPALRAVLDDEAFQRLRTAVANLDFSQAHALLRAHAHAQGVPETAGGR